MLKLQSNVKMKDRNQLRFDDVKIYQALVKVSCFWRLISIVNNNSTCDDLNVGKVSF